MERNSSEGCQLEARGREPDPSGENRSRVRSHLRKSTGNRVALGDRE